jgi:hypothetical protein
MTLEVTRPGPGPTAPPPASADPIVIVANVFPRMNLTTNSAARVP